MPTTLPESLWNNRDQAFLTSNWFGRRKVFVEDLFTEKAIGFLQKPHPKPFFLNLAYTARTPITNAAPRLTPMASNVPSNAPYNPACGPISKKVRATCNTQGLRHRQILAATGFLNIGARMSDGDEVIVGYDAGLKELVFETVSMPV